MSVAVSLKALWEQIPTFGDHPYLITVASDGSAHVVSVRARAVDDRVVLTAGRTSRANVLANTAVTLLWAAPDGGAYSLIVDGHGKVLDGDVGEVAIDPTRAVLHRIAGAPDDLSSCVRLVPSD